MRPRSDWPDLRQASAHAVDVLGPEVPLEIEHGALRFPISPTPIFIDPSG
ncbi:hypothetical protein [Nocardia sp. NPDC047654]